MPSSQTANFCRLPYVGRKTFINNQNTIKVQHCYHRYINKYKIVTTNDVFVCLNETYAEWRRKKLYKVGISEKNLFKMHENLRYFHLVYGSRLTSLLAEYHSVFRSYILQNKCIYNGRDLVALLQISHLFFTPF